MLRATRLRLVRAMNLDDCEERFVLSQRTHLQGACYQLPGKGSCWWRRYRVASRVGHADKPLAGAQLNHH